MIKKLLVVLVIFFSFDCVYAFDFCTASKEYLEYQALSDEEKAKYIEPIYCSEMVDNKLTSYNALGSTANILFPELSVHHNTSSSSYSSYHLGLVNPSEDQLGTGLCWGFSAMSVVETNAILNSVGSFNFSEAHLGYSILGGDYSNNNGLEGRYNSNSHDGGRITYAPTYFFNGYGQFLESEMPFNNNLNFNKTNLRLISPNNYTLGNKMISIESYYIDNTRTLGTCGINQINLMKDRILEYGSVQGTIYMDQDLFLDANEEYYKSTTNDSPFPNHGIVIVGWDDNISKDKFGATRDGAWIVKNSWGSTWSSDGLFYISYDDEFVCNEVATYSGVSDKTFTYIYNAADVIGAFDFNMYGTTYIASKFTKKSNGRESLDRVSFAVAEYANHNVYLSKNNSLKKEDWILLGSENKNVLGIDSINLSDIYVDDDFTIIVEYNTSPGLYSTILTMRNVYSDTEHINISSNTNFISADAQVWKDMYEDNCEPIIYAYTNPVNDNVNLKINSLSNYNDLIKVKFTRANIDTNDISYQVLDESLNDITSHFTVTPNYKNNELIITNDNTISGTLTFKIKADDVETTKTFKLIEDLISNSEDLKISNDIITVTIPRNTTYTYQDLLNSLEYKNTTVTVNNSTGNTIIDNSSSVGTNSTLVTNSNNYKLVILGDVSGDGTVNSADLMKIVKYLKGSSLNDEQKQAADPTKDNLINSADLMRIVKYLKGTANFSL